MCKGGPRDIPHFGPKGLPVDGYLQCALGPLEPQHWAVPVLCIVLSCGVCMQLIDKPVTQTKPPSEIQVCDLCSTYSYSLIMAHEICRIGCRVAN